MTQPLDAEEIRELVRLLGLSGETLETLLDFDEDPTNWYGAGDLATIGKSLEKLSKWTLDCARGLAINAMGSNNEFSDGKWVFQQRTPHTQVRLNIDEVKDKYPQEEYPELYRQYDVAGSVTISRNKTRGRGRKS